jgi:hypothetical protein
MCRQLRAFFGRVAQVRLEELECLGRSQSESPRDTSNLSEVLAGWKIERNELASERVPVSEQPSVVVGPKLQAFFVK